MRGVVIGLVLALAMGGIAHAAGRPLPPPVTVEPLPIGAAGKPFSLDRLVLRMSFGQLIGRQRGGLLCIPLGELKWNTNTSRLIQERELPSIFRQRMSRAGFKIEGDPNALFEQPGSSADLAVGGLVTDLDFNACLPFSRDGNYEIVSGDVVMSVEWQIYSRLQQRVVATVKTTGGARLGGATHNGWSALLNQSLAENADALAASSEFRKLIVADPGDTAQTSSPQAPIRLAGPATKAGRPVSEAVGSVVAVFAGDGFGSGFLVSDDGYLLTNWHVVQTARQVRVRWSDGFEAIGEVVRSDKRRDVALIKVGPHGRQPLALRRGSVQPGESVFAIGTPLDPKFQSTITRGVVSASRLYDGFSFIQSDVATNHGNSGGPLLDEKGAVIGIAVSGYEIGGAPVGINLFIPIGDALDFLNLTAAP